MSDPNGAKIEDPKPSMKNTSKTSNTDYHTFGYFGLHWLDFAKVDFKLPKEYYMRASTNKDDSKTDVLLEMIKFSDQSVVESYSVDQNGVVDFSSLEKVAEGNAATNYLSKYYPIKAKYDTTARDESKNIAGQIILYFAQIDGGWSMGSYNIPMNSAYVTKYVTDYGKLLATYSIKGSSKQLSTPSGVRDFSGYDFKETQVSGSPKLNVYNVDAPEADAKNYQYKRLLEMVKSDGTAVKFLWVVDPTLSEEAKAKLNFADESTDGFIKILETSEMEPGGVNENIKVITGQKLSDGTILTSEDEAAEIESKADDNDGVNFGANNLVKIWTDPTNENRYIRLGFVGNYANVRPYGITTPGKSAYLQTTWAPQTNLKLIPLENDALYVPTLLHVYTKEGGVVVKYVDQEGNEISGTGLTSADATTGTTISEGGQTAVDKTSLTDTPMSYNTDTETLKPQVIKKDDGTVYYLVGLDKDKSYYDNNTPNDATDDESVGEKGTVQRGTTTITYKYEKAGSVTINYISTDGTVIRKPVKDVENAKAGDVYNAAETTTDNTGEKPATITVGDKVYRLVTKSGTTTGTNPVNYDDNGVVTSGKDVAGQTGTVISGKDLQVTYVYEEVAFGNVVVKYVVENEDGTTTEIKEEYKDTTNAEVGTAYNTAENSNEKPQTIIKDGKVYELVRVEGVEKGRVVAGTTTVKYIYKEKSTNPTQAVTTEWLTEDGIVLKAKTTGTHKAGTFEGYEFVRTEVDAQGNTKHIFKKVTKEAQIIESPSTGVSDKLKVFVLAAGASIVGLVIAILAKKKNKNEEE